MKDRKLWLAAVCSGVILSAGLTTGTVLAWLTDTAQPVKNTFTVGRVGLTLTETWNTDANHDGRADAWSGVLVPGQNLKKDPMVTVAADSEDCWLFVKLEPQNWPDAKEADGITPKVFYSISDGWLSLTGEEGVYYRRTDSAEEIRKFPILAGNEVTVSSNLTKQEIGAVADMRLSVTAWAIQYAGMETAETAWERLND